jgi:hypothetical protein
LVNRGTRARNPVRPGPFMACEEDAYHPSASIVRHNIKCRTGLTKGCNVILIRVQRASAFQKRDWIAAGSCYMKNATSHRPFQIGEGGIRKGVSPDPTGGCLPKPFCPMYAQNAVVFRNALKQSSRPRTATGADFHTRDILRRFQIQETFESQILKRRTEERSTKSG